MEEKEYAPYRIYNVDEIELCIVQSRCLEVIFMRGKRQAAALTSAERGYLVEYYAWMLQVTLCHLWSSSREKIKQADKKWSTCGVPVCFSSVWMLMLDGHHSHTRNLDVIIEAKKHFVIILCLLPHTTHKLLPLDKTVMGAIKNEEEGVFMRTENRAVTHILMCQLFGRAYLKVQSGLSTTGKRYFLGRGICCRNTERQCRLVSWSGTYKY